MKRVTFLAFFGVLAFAIFAMGCMDREPAPVCPVPTEVAQKERKVDSYDGVDLLVVVDNSRSMDAEQQILSSGFYTLVNSLVNPTSGWEFPAVENVRVAIVTSDMGLQYGDPPSIEAFPYGLDIQGCTERDPRGDDGKFQAIMVPTINPDDNAISCDEGGNQCPEDWDCVDGKCAAPGGVTTTNCPTIGAGWAETSEEAPVDNLATQVACMASQGVNGCGIEQQLEAAVRGLDRNDNQRGFMKDKHLLAVLVVSDEEDCSVAKKGLFGTDGFKSGAGSDGLLNVSCNLPEENEEQFLFDTGRYWRELVELKDGRASAVIFAAIVGVPDKGTLGTNSSPCEGSGNALGTCLDHPLMALEKQNFEDQNTGFEFIHFRPACTREENGDEVTSARPGRRYVKVASAFGKNGYVYSICNADWSPAMAEIANLIASSMGENCFDKRLDWTLLPRGEVKGCNDCGVAKCDVVVEIVRSGKDLEKRCPFKVDDESKVGREATRDTSGNIVSYTYSCPLSKLPAPLDCDAAETMYPPNYEGEGWFYCESKREDFDEACEDGIDNDGDGLIDAEDDECAACVSESKQGCKTGCSFGVQITKKAKSQAQGGTVKVQCLQQFSFEDENCQERTWESCTDGEDNDGNGAWDCVDTIAHSGQLGDGELAGRADAHCCPLDVVVETNKQGEEVRNCTIATDKAGAPLVNTNCGGPPPKVADQDVPIWDACIAAAETLKCNLKF
jgi:hypothetical protein